MKFGLWFVFLCFFLGGLLCRSQSSYTRVTLAVVTKKKRKEKQKLSSKNKKKQLHFEPKNRKKKVNNTRRLETFNVKMCEKKKKCFC